MIEISNIKNERWFRIKPFLDLGLVSSRAWLAGGALRSLIDGSPIADYDMFFTNEMAMRVTEEKLFELGAKRVFRHKHNKLITYRYGDLKIQLIGVSFHSTMEDAIKRFHFTAAQFITDGYRIFTPSRENIKHALKKKLVLSNNDLPHTPVATIKAICKYKDKGYDVNDASSMLVKKLLEASPQDYDCLDMIFYEEKK